MVDDSGLWQYQSTVDECSGQMKMEHLGFLSRQQSFWTLA